MITAIYNNLTAHIILNCEIMKKFLRSKTCQKCLLPLLLLKIIMGENREDGGKIGGSGVHFP